MSANRDAYLDADVLSDVLRAVRLTAAVYFDVDLTSPWGTGTPSSREIAAAVMPGAQRVIEYHFIERGRCWGHAVGHEPIRLREGDLIVFPHGDARVLSSERARIVCCFLACDERPYNPLLTALPSVIHLSGSGPHPRTGWIGTLLNIAASESNSARPGTENVLARLSELMFVETIRQYLETLPPERTGWLAGLRDPVVGQALAALHAEPQAPWTVARLARLVGVSRSVFAERFTGMVGHPPMHYLALWRMQLASLLLVDGGQVAAVAGAVGYESEAAFSRAFKKRVGQAPTTWRRATGLPLHGHTSANGDHRA